MNAHIILAAGTQDRWNKGDIIGLPAVKQLVRVTDNEILIERIQRQFPGSIVVTKNEEIKKHSEKWFEPEDNPVTLGTLFSTKDLWKDWTTILLGDVLYGRKTIRALRQQEAPVMFYGDKNEIYAIKFHLSMSMAIVSAINKVISSEHFEMKYGKLWNLYRAMNGIDFRQHAMGAFFTTVFDSEDFDNKEQYLRYAKNKRIRG